MSQVYPQKYNHQVCPHCKSKKLKNVSVVDMGSKWYIEAVTVETTGYMCGNCKRYHPEREMKWVYDRGEMRRDIKSLQKFLAGE